MINIIFLKILKMSAIGTIVGLLIIVLKSLLKNKISTKYSNILWSFFIILLLIPINFKSEISIQNYVSEIRYVEDIEFEYKETQDDFTISDAKKSYTTIDLVSNVWII